MPGHKRPCKRVLLYKGRHTLCEATSLCPAGPTKLTEFPACWSPRELRHFCWVTWASACPRLRIFQSPDFIPYPGISDSSWFPLLDSNLRVGRLSDWIFLGFPWVTSAQISCQGKGVRSAGSVRMSVAMEFRERRQARLPATSLSPQSLKNSGARESTIRRQNHRKPKRTIPCFSSVNQPRY